VVKIITSARVHGERIAQSQRHCAGGRLVWQPAEVVPVWVEVIAATRNAKVAMTRLTGLAKVLRGKVLANGGGAPANDFSAHASQVYGLALALTLALERLGQLEGRFRVVGRSTPTPTPVCECAAIRESLLGGHPNREGMEEYREDHGHYPGCSKAPTPPCKCVQIAEGMAMGKCRNPEEMKAWHASHGHYPGCPQAPHLDVTA
jgi:hypothetical protein